jgi:hypothetical protein
MRYRFRLGHVYVRGLCRCADCRDTMVCFLICRFRLVAFREHRAGLACGAEDVGEVLRISGTDGVMDGSREKLLRITAC